MELEFHIALCLGHYPGKTHFFCLVLRKILSIRHFLTVPSSIHHRMTNVHLIKRLSLVFCLATLLPHAHGEDTPAPPVKTPPTPGRAPATSPIKSARVFYFGHSLVGHDLPQMLGAFAKARGKEYAVQGQVGWGTPLMSHSRWEGKFEGAFVPLGFPDELPGTLLFREDGRTALASGKYDAVVFTETNGFVQGKPGDWKLNCDPNHPFGGCTVEHLGKLVSRAREHNPNVRTYFYTNWKDFAELGGMEAWIRDIRAHQGWWDHVAELVDNELKTDGVKSPPLTVIPTALVLAKIVEQARGGALADYGLRDHSPLFSDNVHLTRLGFYIVAVTHYAAIFRESPVGLPHTVDVVSGDKRKLEKDGFSIDARLAAHIQQEAWEILKASPLAQAIEKAQK